MTIELDARPAPERKEGDFRRSAKGAPYVSDPTGATVKGGGRRGEVKWCQYGRPSAFGKQVENQYNLLRWKERALVYGCASPDVAQLAEALAAHFSDPKYRACPLLRKHVAAGWLGKKSGRGFYAY